MQNYIESYKNSAIEYSKAQQTNNKLYTWERIKLETIKNSYISCIPINHSSYFLKQRDFLHRNFFETKFKLLSIKKNNIEYQHFKCENTIPVIYVHGNSIYAVWLAYNIKKYLRQHKIPSCLCEYIFELCI